MGEDGEAVLAELEQHERDFAAWARDASDARRRFLDERDELLLRAKALGLPLRDVAEKLNGAYDPEDVFGMGPYSSQRVGQLTRRAEELAHDVLDTQVRHFLRRAEEENDGE